MGPSHSGIARRVTLRLAAVVLVVGLSACGQRAAVQERGEVRVGVVRVGDRIIVRAIPVFGIRINALLPPQLEFPSGRAERLGSPSVTADSSYFLAPPEVALPRDTPLAGALLRVSICDSGATVCRTITVPL